MCNDADENLLPIVVTILEKKKKQIHRIRVNREWYEYSYSLFDI